MEKTPNDSKAEVIIRMFPSDANPAGNVFGGAILKHIDMVAGIVAQRYSQTNAVTVSMDKISFLKPVFVGNVLFVNARVNYVQKSSMEIEVNVEAEDIAKGTRVHTGNAYVTFVALMITVNLLRFQHYVLIILMIKSVLMKVNFEWNVE